MDTPDNLPPAADTRPIADDSGPLKGRLAAWALDGEPVLGLCPVHGGWGENVGQHVPGLVKMCRACYQTYKAEHGIAPGNPLDL